MRIYKWNVFWIDDDDFEHFRVFDSEQLAQNHVKCISGLYKMIVITKYKAV